MRPESMRGALSPRAASFHHRLAAIVEAQRGHKKAFTYCTQALDLAEGAYNRIEAARAARRFPLVLDAIANGSLTLTSARLLAPHLTTENHQAVLDAARHKAKREIEVLIATPKPKPPVATVPGAQSVRIRAVLRRAFPCA
jgi:hypothetical protein